jgi:hypothetical protein
MQYLYESDKSLVWIQTFRVEEMSVATVVRFERLLTTTLFEDMVQSISVSGSKEETSFDKNELKRVSPMENLWKNCE